MAKSSPSNVADNAERAPWENGADATEAANTQTKAVAVQGGAAAEIAQRNQAMIQDFVSWGLEKVSGTDEDQYAVMAAMYAEIMDATDVAGALATQSAVHAADIVGRPFLLHGFDFREGTFEDSVFPFYAALNISMIGSDKVRVCTTGATKILFKLRKLDDLGDYPVACMFTSKDIKGGKTVLDLVLADI